VQDEDNKKPMFDPEELIVALGVANPIEVMEASRYVDPNDFADPRLRLVWKALVDLVQSGAKQENIDYFSVAAKCANGEKLRKEIAMFIAKIDFGKFLHSSLVNFAKRIHRRATMRLALDKMRVLATEIKDQLTAPEGDVESLEAEMASLSMAVAARSDKEQIRKDYKDIGKEVSQYFDELASQSHPPETIPTGIVALDKRLGGGMRPGRLYSVLGWTGSGKTSFASQLCDHAVSTGRRAIMFSMELDPVDVFIRDVERTAGRSRWGLRAKSLVEREASAKDLVAAQAQLMMETKGKLVFGESMSVEQIRQVVLTEKLRGGPVHLIAVDHAQVAAPSAGDKRGQLRYLEIKATAEGLRDIAKQLNIVVLLTAQMNPPPKGERPSLNHVRESKDLVNTSDFVFIIWHEKDEMPDGEFEISQSWIIVDKARAAAPGKVAIRYDGALFRFSDMAHAEDDE
jgi:replicative DNA helicase